MAQNVNHREYVSTIRRYLPAEAFLPAPAKLLRILLHVCVIFLCYIALRTISSPVLSLLLSAIIGHSLLCIGFLAHELSPGAIVRNKALRYPLEIFLWGMNSIPATMWRRVHNQTHHAHANTPIDPDRPFLTSEESWITRMYSNLFYPHRRASWINPLVAFHLTGYILRNVVASLYPASTKPPFVPACPCYSVAQRCAILAEICFIVLWQVLVFFLVGSSWRAWAWAVAVPHIIASASVMSYIFTNHFLNPVSETYDPLAQTTSVTVPRLMDRIHEHFSLHTEHHLFPGMNSDFYPLVTLALEKYFPERYNRMSLVSAWKKLWHRECFAEIQAQPVACRPNDD